MFIKGINHPSDMFRGDDLMPDESESEPHRAVVLFGTNPGLGEHDVGLIYDQKNHKASMGLGIEDINSVITPIEEHQDMSYPLETVSRALTLFPRRDAKVLETLLITWPLCKGAYKVD